MLNKHFFFYKNLNFYKKSLNSYKLFYNFQKMSVEAWKLKETEKKKETLDEKKLLAKEELRQREFQKTKEQITLWEQTNKSLDELRELLEKWLLRQETIDSVMSWNNISPDEIEEIFTKIDEIENVNDIDKYLPREFRITKDEYFKALEDKLFRAQILTKINTALTIISHQITWDTPMWLNLFSWFLILLDKNLVIIQENNIDVKNSLEWLDKNSNLTLWQKIKKFFTNLFLNK